MRGPGADGRCGTRTGDSGSTRHGSAARAGWSLPPVALALAFSVVPLPVGAQRQEPRFDRITIDDGLSQSSVYAIAQDGLGFMWFGTQDGLNRYDGHSFLVHRHVPGNPSSLSDNNVLSLHADSQGRLWIGTEGGGLNRLDLHTGAIVRYRHDPARATSLSHDWVTSIGPAGTGGLWVGTHEGVCRMLDEKGRFERLLLPSGEPACGSQVEALLETRQGDLWVGTSGEGACRLDAETGEWTRFRHDPTDPGSLGGDTVRVLHEDAEGAVWVGNMSGLDRLDPATGRFEHFRLDPKNPASLSNDYVYCLLDDRRGNLWVGTQSGLNLLDRSTGRFTRHTNDPARPESLGNDYIMSLFEDRSGLLWVGTGSGGLSKLNPRKTQFGHVTAHARRDGPLSSPVVWSIQPDSQGNLWIGTENGLNRRPPGSESFVQYLHDPADPTSLSNNNVRAVIEDYTGTIWAGTDGGGLNRFSAVRGGFVRYRHDPRDPRSLSSDQVLALGEDRSGALWVGTRGGGVCRLERDRKGFQCLRSGQGNRGPSDDIVYDVLEDHRGLIWLGTLGGLNCFDRETGEFRHFRSNPSDPSSLTNDGVGVVFEDGQGRLWVGTDRGLNRFVEETESFVRYTTAEGLPNDFVYGILQDSQGLLWISTNGGLSRLDPETGVFRNFDVQDGLQSNEFNAGAHAVDQAGRLYFGGVNGFNAFSAEGLEANPHPPAVVITAFRAVDEPLPLPRDGGQVGLSHTQNQVAFEFAALDYTAPSKNRYAYMLEGVEADWVDAGHRRYASYAHLGGGDYVFRVKAANSDGVWNHEGTAVRFRVTSPPWRSFWAYLGYLLLLVAVVLATVRYKTRAQALVLTERLRRMTSSLTQTLDLAQVVERLLDHLTEVIPYDRASVFLRGEAGWEARATREPRPLKVASTRPEREAELLAKVESTGQPLLIGDLSDPADTRGGWGEPELQCVLGIPLVVQERVGGIVLLYGRRAAAFDKQAVDLAITVVTQTGFAVENARLFGRINQLAITDGLTGVTNRRHFFELADREYRNALRYGRSLSVIMLDIDHFKSVNDTYGHAVGDEVLRLVADHSRSCLRQTDVVARYGGEEFVMLLPEADREAAVAVAERVCRGLAEARPWIGGQELTPITASLGVASALAHEEDLASLINRADRALYEAKRQGRNRVVAAE